MTTGRLQEARGPDRVRVTFLVMPSAERYTRAWTTIESDLDLVLGGVSQALQRMFFKDAHSLCMEADDRKRIYVKCTDRPAAEALLHDVAGQVEISGAQALDRFGGNHRDRA